MPSISPLWRYRLALTGDLVESSDIFICECSNVTADYWGHLSVEELEHTDQTSMWANCISATGQSSREAAQTVAVLDATIADDSMRIHWP